MQAGPQKLSVREKVGYSLGDAAANFVFMTMIFFQLSFYTDTLGITAAAAGSLLLVGRLWDAFFDPMMGIMADRTNTRWGKFRPWVLWTALPWGLIMVLAYTTPNLAMTGKIIYACVTNILLMTLYSANNTPYSAMTGVMTGDVNERTSISSYRFVAALIAQLIVGGFTLPLVAKFGHGQNARGWQVTIGLWAVVCVFLFLVTFLSTRERIQPDPKQKSSARQDFRELFKNGPWIAMFVLTLFHFIYVAMRNGTMIYYFQYYVKKDRLYDLLQNLGLASAGQGPRPAGVWHSLLNTFGLIVDAEKTNVSSVGFSLFNMSSLFVTVIGVLFSTFLAMRFGKKAVSLVGFSLATVFVAMFFLLPADAIRSHLCSGVCPGAGLRPHYTASLGHVCRRGGLRGVEDRTAHDRGDLCHHPVRPQGGLEPGRRHRRLAAVRIRLHGQRGADAGSSAGHPFDDERLSRHIPFHRRRLPAAL